MSSGRDVSTASDQDQDDDQLSGEDAGGLFGSGSEDEQSGFEAPLSHCELKLILSISVSKVSARNGAS